MVKENLLHFAHLLKMKMQVKKPFRGRRILLKIADSIIGEPKRAMQIKTIYGFKIKIDPVNDNGVEKSIFYTGTYEAGTLYILDNLLNKGDNFFDIGSNIGLMGIYAAHKVGDNGTVHAFEPEPDTFKILKENCTINKLKNIRINNFALGDNEGTANIYPNLDINRGASSLVRSDGSIGKKVTITTLDKYLTQVKINSIRLIKIDIEGYEFKMLKGAIELLRSENAPIICIEYSKKVQRNERLEDIYHFLKNVNAYRIFKFMLSKEKISFLTEVFFEEQMPEHDNVFCFLESHLSDINSSIFNLKN